MKLRMLRLALLIGLLLPLGGCGLFLMRAGEPSLFGDDTHLLLLVDDAARNACAGKDCFLNATALEGSGPQTRCGCILGYQCLLGGSMLHFDLSQPRPDGIYLVPVPAGEWDIAILDQRAHYRIADGRTALLGTIRLVDGQPRLDTDFADPRLARIKTLVDEPIESLRALGPPLDRVGILCSP